MSEQQLINEILSGNTNSFKILVNRHQGMGFSTAMGFVHSKEDAEDITQEVFIHAFRSLTTCQKKSEFSTWLYRISVSMSINFVNRNKLRRLLIETGENLKVLLNISSDEKMLNNDWKTTKEIKWCEIRLTTCLKNNVQHSF